MPTTLGRNLHMCFTKIKRPSTHHDHLSMNPDDDHSHPFPSSSSSSSILIKNFNSLYDTTTSKSLSSSSTLSYEPEPDFATIVASQRFFFTSPGSSNSIIESSSPSIATLESKSWNNSPSFKDSVAVPTYSPDPYMDFRRSMQEMVEARDLVDVKSNWDYLHELLLCYLALNPKNTHKFIIGAFADLLVSLMSPPETEGAGGGPRR
ncbi:hypothetical protein LWI28_009237 [Acer negundo]|uniref:Transcription repressor n=1 Tax=Acer negundo TaxID=4023 RepID=A0AAD5IZK7_ACENE|nr:hypothetical protein LWI28_009237 [Acer negundo]